jgi:hypothetical protein
MSESDCYVEATYSKSKRGVSEHTMEWLAFVARAVWSADSLGTDVERVQRERI